MSDVVKRNPMLPLTEWFDWFNSGWPAIADWRHDGARAVRIEDRLEQDRYVVRAQILGVDPDKDVEITVEEGVLTISAERREEVKGKGRSEFHLAPSCGGYRCRRARRRNSWWRGTRTASLRLPCRSGPRRPSGTPSR
jgi:HSP20 family molecular chaperone IbpA